MIEILKIAIPTLIGGFIGWIVSRKKTTAEVESIVVETTTRLIKQYKESYSDLETMMQRKCDDMQRVINLEKELRQQSEESLRREIDQLRNRLNTQ
jgi:polyhydroxyalkanoate synthesis regulator phasin